MFAAFASLPILVFLHALATVKCEDVVQDDMYKHHKTYTVTTDMHITDYSYTRDIILSSTITTYTKRGITGRRKLTSKQGHGAPNPAFIEPGHRAVQMMAEEMGGTPGGTIGEPFNVPLTAHFMGGCAIGDSPETGVVDPYQRLFGHEGLHVADGSTITANLGVNPSLTITAQAERAMSYWPNKGEEDVRPAVGEAYRKIEPIAPKHPVVPADAPAALRLPIIGVS